MTTQAADLERAFHLLRNPSLWPGTSTEDLFGNLYIHSLLLGERYSDEYFEEIRPLYWHIAKRTTVKERQALLKVLADQVESHEASPYCLLPFLCADEETAVISTASLNLAVLIPPQEGDPLTGCKYLLQCAESATTDASLAGILQGILLLGDRRVLPLLDRCWEPLGPEGRRILRHSWSGFVYAATIDFLLGWLERTEDESEYGAIAGVLASYPIRKDAYPFVLNVERKFPANGPEEGPFVKELGRWTFQEYGEIIAPRLCALAASETGEKVIPKLLAAWGIGSGYGEEDSGWPLSAAIGLDPTLVRSEVSSGCRKAPAEQEWIETFPPEKRPTAEIAVLYARAVNLGEVELFGNVVGEGASLESQSNNHTFRGRAEFLAFVRRQAIFRGDRPGGHGIALDVGRSPWKGDPCVIAYQPYGRIHQDWLQVPRCFIELTLDGDGKLEKALVVTIFPNPATASPGGLFPGIPDIAGEVGRIGGIPPEEIELLLFIGSGQNDLDWRARQTAGLIAERFGCLPQREISLAGDLTQKEEELRESYKIEGWPALLVLHRGELIWRYLGVPSIQDVDRDIRKVTDCRAGETGASIQ